VNKIRSVVVSLLADETGQGTRASISPAGPSSQPEEILVEFLALLTQIEDVSFAPSLGTADTNKAVPRCSICRLSLSEMEVVS
jgi:hypothetical protein